MSNKVYFMNNGVFDLRGMLTMGLSAKQDEGAIGFFGTGFKYAVAIILRNAGSVKITTKTIDGSFYIYEFFLKKESFRDQEFDFVYIRDHVTGETIPCNFTTRMGINWEAWMAFRELYCNCKDEKGKTSDNYESNFDTVIEVDCLEISKAFQNIDDYIMPEMTPIFTHHLVDIYKIRRPYVYYKGIAVLASSEMAYSYNIKSALSLTEDRTVKHEFEVKNRIQIALQACDVEEVVKTVIQGVCAERKAGFNDCWETSDTFLNTAERLLKTEAGICESARALLVSRRAKSGNFAEFKIDNVQQKMVDKAKSFLLKIDIPVDQFPIKFVTGLGEGVMGRALNDVIYISELPFQMGTKQLASTLMEEWVHLKTGCKDFDRKMQNWLFDKILTIAENINGEPI